MKRPQSDAPTIEVIPETSVVEPPAAVADRPWMDMRDAPRDGTLIEYEDNKYARYRVTRRRMDRRWKAVGFWADAFTAVEIEPAHWRLPSGFTLPGMVL